MKRLWLAILLLAGCGAAHPQVAQTPAPTVVKSEEEWKKQLTPEQFRILRQADTEYPGTGKLLHNQETGDYTCAGCGAVLFKSKAKFDSGTGWPSFYEPAQTDAVALITDDSLGMHRVEVRCAKCGGHLGHVFDDGPAPTHQRFCINSGGLEFKKP